MLQQTLNIMSHTSQMNISPFRPASRLFHRGSTATAAGEPNTAESAQEQGRKLSADPRLFTDNSGHRLVAPTTSAGSDSLTVGGSNPTFASSMPSVAVNSTTVRQNSNNSSVMSENQNIMQNSAAS